MALCSGAPLTAQAPEGPCDERAERWITTAWADYREGRIRTADAGFARALECRPGSLGAMVGLGYTALRSGQSESARSRFTLALEARNDDVDAMVGLALVEWRAGNVDRAAELAERAVELAPAHEEARSLWSRAKGARRPSASDVEGYAAEELPAAPDTLEVFSRTSGDRFEVLGPGGWQPFYIKGVNLGAALPGRHPSQFPDAAVYASWIEQMCEMGLNAVRTYTIHPPHFYSEVRAHNLRHPDRPLWLIHGVWTELPPDDDYENPGWERSFFTEMERIVDLLHGRATLPPRPGHASGDYSADVSRWVHSFIIGREWEPFSVLAFNESRPELTSWRGRFLHLDRGTPMDVWLAKAAEHLVAYETDRYRTQRPVAYTNWPTLDPMHHPTETTVSEEVAIREALGERVERRPREYDNDAAHLSAASVRPTAEFRAGYFAAFHAYPYYPDFMLLDPEYSAARSPYGRSNYFGYLQDLKAAHPNMPVVIAEYGVPASLGTAHLQPQGWHHGGHSEAAMAEIDLRLTQEIAAAGMAGGILFAWIDEWFKKNWLVIDFEIPLDRNRLWLNRLDAEQHYGVLAMEAASGPAGDDVVERAAAWRAIPALYASADGAALRAHADEAYLWLQFEGPRSGGRRILPAELLLGFDMVDPGAGDRRWPGRQGEPLSVGLELVLRVDEEGARLMIDPPSNPFGLEPVRGGLDGPQPVAPVPPFLAGRSRPLGATPSPTGVSQVFATRSEPRFHRPFRSAPNDDGRYDSLLVITNRPRFARDSTEYLALGYDRGVLPRGPLPDGAWEADAELGVIEIRIPWTLLNVTDPSRRRVLQDLPPGVPPERIGALPETGRGVESSSGFGTVMVPDIGIAARWSLGAEEAVSPAIDWPAAGDDVARFGWETWDAPRWRWRPRPVFDALKRWFAGMGPVVATSDAVSAEGSR